MFADLGVYSEVGTSVRFCDALLNRYCVPIKDHAQREESKSEGEHQAEYRG